MSTFVDNSVVWGYLCPIGDAVLDDDIERLASCDYCRDIEKNRKAIKHLIAGDITDRPLPRFPREVINLERYMLAARLPLLKSENEWLFGLFIALANLISEIQYTNSSEVLRMTFICIEHLGERYLSFSSFQELIERLKPELLTDRGCLVAHGFVFTLAPAVIMARRGLPVDEIERYCEQLILEDYQSRSNRYNDAELGDLDFNGLYVANLNSYLPFSAEQDSTPETEREFGYQSWEKEVLGWGALVLRWLPDDQSLASCQYIRRQFQKSMEVLPKGK